MRNLYLIFLFITSTVCAQQETLFSQFFYQKTVSNPAAAGSSENPVLTAFHRQQWAGLEGAPVSQVFSFQTPAFGARVGLGLTLLHERIGLFSSTQVNGAYAYRIRMDQAVLSFGVQANFLQRKANWEEARTLTPSQVPGDERVSVFNTGAGVYFENDHFFAGVSVPNLLEKGLRRNYQGIVDDFSGSVRHVFISAGWIVRVSENVRLRPAFASRLLMHAPPSSDIHVSVGLLPESRMWLGMTYRWSQSEYASAGDMLVGMCQYRLSSRLTFGFAYELSLGTLQRQTAGTYELMVEYGFKQAKAAVRNPRYFF